MYNAIDIARHIINYDDINNLKLQKILYFIQAHYLSKYNIQIFKENIYASEFGPVVWEVYREFSQFGSLDIPKIDNYFYYETPHNIWSIKKIIYQDNILSKKDKNIINNIVDIFKNYHNHELNDIIFHQSPYYNYVGKNIPLQHLKLYFS